MCNRTLAWVLVRLGLAEKLDGFPARFRVHMAVYLLQALGFPTRYDFDMYVRGPYSPGLADDYMALAREGLVEEYARYADVDEGRWGPIVDVLAGEDVLVLEAAATLHMFLAAGWPVEEAVDRIVEMKPYMSRRLVEAGLTLLGRLCGPSYCT